jgi:excisionase family DNA binding protein
MNKDGPPDRPLTVREVAKFLRVTPGTIYRMTSARAIPGAFRVSGSWRFLVEPLDRWTKNVEYRAALGMTKTQHE